jgi:dTDP-4-dehydrorhamnose 3,5-epimerase
MDVTNLSLEGLKLIQPAIFADDRGFFTEHYRKPLYASHGILCDFVQDNHSYSKKGTLRGMHFQTAPGQAKLVSVIDGEIFDVVVDIRPDSPTFGRWEGVVLDGKKREQLFIPAGFAHGFCVTSESAHVFYKVSALYDPATEKGFRFDDPRVGIEWPKLDLLLSSRDQMAPLLHEVIR